MLGTKRVLVRTELGGGASGIGRAVAVLFARNQAGVAGDRFSISVGHISPSESGQSVEANPSAS
jgi:hypothetical protein